MIVCVHYFYITGRWQGPCSLTAEANTYGTFKHEIVSLTSTDATLMRKVTGYAVFFFFFFLQGLKPGSSTFKPNVYVFFLKKILFLN